MENKLAKTKGWIKEHKEQIVAYSFVGGVVTFYVGVVALAVKAQANYNAEMANIRNDVNEAIARGAQVLPGPNGMFWILEPES